MTRWLLPIWFFLLVACAGSAAPGGGTGTATGGGSSSGGGPLDGNLSGAQPLGGGFPAPSLEGDPGKNVFTLNFGDRSVECIENTPGNYLFHFEGFVGPAVWYEAISGRVLRLVDPAAKTYLDVELIDRTGDFPPGLKVNYTGYFNVKFSGPFPSPLKGYFLPVDAAKDSLGKILPCATDSCIPAGAIAVEGDFMEGIDSSKLAEKPSCMSMPDNTYAPHF